MLLFFSLLFQRVVLLLVQSTRWQQNAFKYLLDSHHSLYPFITPWLCSHSPKSVLLLLLHSRLRVWWPLSHAVSPLQLSENHSLSLNHQDHTDGKLGIIRETSEIIFLCYHIRPASAASFRPCLPRKGVKQKENKSGNQCIWSKYTNLVERLKA